MPSSPAKIFKAVTCLVLFFLLVYIVRKLLSPFMAAAILAIVLEPAVGYIETRGISRRKSVAAVLLLLLMISNLLIFIICTRLIKEIEELLEIMPRYRENIAALVSKAGEVAYNIFKGLPKEYSQVLVAGMEVYWSRVIGMLVSLNTRIINGMLAIPSIIIWVLLLIISLYFMLADKEKILNWMYKYMPRDLREGVTQRYLTIKDKSLNILKVYFTIGIFTAVQAGIGLSILGIDYALLIGIIVGLLDLIPFIGPGLVFIPWIILDLVKGEFFRAFTISVMYTMLLISREILEAKMISKRLGLHPLISMVAMYLGFQVMGLTGLIVGPLVFLMVKEFLGLEFLKCC